MANKKKITIEKYITFISKLSAAGVDFCSPAFRFHGDGKDEDEKWAFAVNPDILEIYIKHLKQQLEFANAYKLELKNKKEDFV